MWRVITWPNLQANQMEDQRKLSIINLLKIYLKFNALKEEISQILDISSRTLQKDEEFLRIYKKGIESGRMSLRRMQYINPRVSSRCHLNVTRHQCRDALISRPVFLHIYVQPLVKSVFNDVIKFSLCERLFCWISRWCDWSVIIWCRWINDVVFIHNSIPPNW